MEQVQRSAARFVAGDYRRTSSVTAMCTDLKWDSLQTRRVARDATMLFKVYHGFVGIQLPAIIIKADTALDAITSLNSELFLPPVSSISIHSMYAAYRYGTLYHNMLYPHLLLSHSRRRRCQLSRPCRRPRPCS